MKKAGLAALVVVVVLAAFGGSVHASGDVGPHSPAECLVCAFCSLLAAFH
jgi:hypothetical protein